jgi:hypothetical protein
LSGLEQAVLGGWRLDTQAFSASGADVDGAEFAAFDTLQQGLAGGAVGEGGLEHGHPAVGGVIDEQGAQVVVHADAPGGAGGELLAGDEPVAQPAVQGGGSEPEFFGGVGHGERVSFGGVVAGLVAGDVPVVAQALDSTGGERQSSGGASGLPVEDPGDLVVRVVDGQSPEEVDGVLVGADRRWLALERHGQVTDRSALPAQDQICAALGAVAVDGDVDFLEQGAQQLFAVLVGGGRGRPYLVEVVAEGEDGGALVGGEGLGAGGGAAGQLGLGRGQFGEGVFPVGFQAAGDQTVFGVDGPVTAFRPARLVAGVFDLAAPLVQGGVVTVFELLGGGQQACSAAGASAARKDSATAVSIATPPTRRCLVPRPSTSSPVPVQ